MNYPGQNKWTDLCRNKTQETENLLSCNIPKYRKDRALQEEWVC